MKKYVQRALKYGGILFLVAVGVLYAIYTIQVRETYVYIPQIRDFHTSLPNAEQEVVHIGDAAVRVDVVKTPEAISRGLGGRELLEENTGMLFVFSDLRMREFWMKDMHIAIDIIWIRDSRVVGVTEYVVPEPGVPDAFLRRYPSPSLVDMVLEVEAGWAEIHGVTSGTVIRREAI